MYLITGLLPVTLRQDPSHFHASRFTPQTPHDSASSFSYALIFLLILFSPNNLFASSVSFFFSFRLLKPLLSSLVRRLPHFPSSSFPCSAPRPSSRPLLPHLIGLVPISEIPRPSLGKLWETLTCFGAPFFHQPTTPATTADHRLGTSVASLLQARQALTSLCSSPARIDVVLVPSCHCSLLASSIRRRSFL